MPAKIRGLTWFATLLAVLVLHCAVQFLLYRYRVVNRSQLPDAVIFYLPFFLAGAGYCWVLRRIVSAPLFLSVFLALVLAVLSALVSVWMPFNTYGT